jgi:multidrug efflux pump subunit AcrB
VPYPGASPEEVEQGIILSIEEGVRGIEGVKEVTATASEGVGVVRVELLTDADQQKVYQDIRQSVDRITTFPVEAEEPQVTLDVRRREVLTMQIYGQANEWALRNVVEEVRDRLLQSKGITQVELVGAREYEVRVEVSQEKLRAYGLTLDAIAQRIRATSVELPGGSLKTSGGEVLVRFKERRDWAGEFAQLPIITTSGGAVLRLGDIAEVTDSFEDTFRSATFNGLPSQGFEVYRVGDQTPIGVSEAVREAMRAIEADLPAGIHYAINRDFSDMYRQRQELLMKNALLGLILVLALMGVFLEFKLAFWGTLLIPTSFLGAMMFLPSMNVTMNMMSMFAFIIALGIVVDNAIVVGENIYEYRQRGGDRVGMAILATREVSVPIAFSNLTNIVAFIPLYFIPGMIGKIWKVIPLVVIATFIISWIESIFILPSHLAHTHSRPHSRLTAKLHRWQQAFERMVSWFIQNWFRRFIELCMKHRYLTFSITLAAFFVIIGYVKSGRIGLILQPRVEADLSVVTAVLPFGSPLNRMEAVRDRLVDAANKVVAKNGGERLSTGVFAKIEDNQVEVNVYLTDADVRPISTSRLTELWRDQVGPIPGLQSLQFQADRGGPASGAALTIELSHRDIDVLAEASARLAEKLEEFPNVKDVDDGYSAGKQQFDFQLKPEGRSLGLTSAEVARQVRHAFYGAEAIRQQRGRNEIKVMVRLPESQRASEYDIEQLMIRTPAGTFVPLRQIADVARGRSYTSITRRDGRRTVSVTGDVSPLGETGQVMATLNSNILPQLARDFPGLTYGYQGRQADMRESLQNLYGGFALAMLAIYFLLAVPFRSYTQPLIIMVSIPFGIVGAVLGHILMGYDLSVMSMMGMVALAGVVVNTSILLIDYANQRRALGEEPWQAIRDAAVRRFRPVMLTTLTTFGGLAPMIFETSRQARFMIPMALSLGYGILISSIVTLLVVPCLYLVLEDIRSLLGSKR